MFHLTCSWRAADLRYLLNPWASFRLAIDPSPLLPVLMSTLAMRQTTCVLVRSAERQTGRDVEIGEWSKGHDQTSCAFHLAVTSVTSECVYRTPLFIAPLTPTDIPRSVAMVADQFAKRRILPDLTSDLNLLCFVVSYRAVIALETSNRFLTFFIQSIGIIYIYTPYNPQGKKH